MPSERHEGDDDEGLCGEIDVREPVVVDRPHDPPGEDEEDAETDAEAGRVAEGKKDEGEPLEGTEAEHQDPERREGAHVGVDGQEVMSEDPQPEGEAQNRHTEDETALRVALQPSEEPRLRPDEEHHGPGTECHRLPNLTQDTKRKGAA